MAELTDAQKKALAIAQARLRMKGPKTNLWEQGVAGMNEGTAQFLGMPADIASGVVNAMRPPKVTGGEVGPDLSVGPMNIEPSAPWIKDPFLGSDAMQGYMDPFISDTAPQSAPQRYARRVGQEVGFGVPTALATAAIPGAGAAARANMPAYMATSTVGDVGGGIAGQTAREIAPNSDAADLIASMAGGIGGAGLGSMFMPKYAASPSLDDVRRMEADKWKSVDAAPATLTPQAEQEYIARVQGTLPANRATNVNLYPRANAAVQDILDNPNRSIRGIEEDRRLAGRAVASNADEAAVGVAMKQEIDDYLKSLDATKVTGSAPEQTVQDMLDARALGARRHKAEAVINKEMRGESRAATSGTGGNEVNAKRQNIRALLDIERDPTLKGRRQGFSPEEVGQMEKIVYGTPGSNFARLAGRLSPTSGALPLMLMGGGGVSGSTAAMMTGNPFFALPVAGAGIGMVAKSIAEGMTKRDIEKLTKMILNGAPLAPSASGQAAKAAIIQQLISRSAPGPN